MISVDAGLDNGMVANAIQPEEMLAARVLSHVLRVQVAHTDVSGESDLAFLTDGDMPAAVEVTFFTDQQTKVSQDAWVREREFVVTQLRSSWNVTVQGESARYKLLKQNLEPHLAALEAAEVTSYDQWSIGHRLLETIPEVVRALAALRVVQASVMKTKDRSVQHIFISPMAGYTARGSDAALSDIEEYLLGREDNARKLQASKASERHIFVWLDMDTPGAVARPFTGGRIVENFDHFGLPSRPPELPEPMTDLWVLHIGTGVGWRWSGTVGWVPLDLQAQLIEWRTSAVAESKSDCHRSSHSTIMDEPLGQGEDWARLEDVLHRDRHNDRRDRRSATTCAGAPSCVEVLSPPLRRRR